MIKYILTKGGIKDQETGALIPINLDNRHYEEYLEWVTKGNTAIPIQPSSDYDLVDDKWVFVQKKEDVRVSAEKIAELKADSVELFAFVYELFNILKAKGLVTNLDVPQDLRQKAANWKILLDEIASL